MPRPEWAPWLLAIAAAVVVVAGLSPASRHDVDRSECTAVALVDERLVCGDDGPYDDPCGARHVLRAGDTLVGCARGRMTAPDLVAFDVPVDPNEAGAAELQSLPGIGPVLAQRIVEGRPYADADALLEVSGVGPRTLARIRPRLRLPDRQP